METEVNKVVFIDNHNNILNATTYHKWTYSGLLLNFNSFTSRFYKISLIKCLNDRAYNINNTWTSFHNGIAKIKESLKRKSFPSFLIDKITGSFGLTWTKCIAVVISLIQSLIKHVFTNFHTRFHKIFKASSKKVSNL